MPDASQSEKLRGYLELLRASNVLTAVADIWMGMALATGGLEPLGVAVTLSLASVGLYLGGMALNDVMDASHDQQHRTTRPIPSGRVPRAAAMRLAVGLILLGLAGAGFASWQLASPAPIVIGALLAAIIWAYDASPKDAAWRPLLMGACRGLNVLLGLSAAGQLAMPVGWYVVALAMMMYICGVTLFARTEERESKRGALLSAMAICLAGIGLLAALPFMSLDLGSATLRVTQSAWLLLWCVVTMLIARRFVAAILQPTSRHVQSAVGNAIQSVILIDAALAWGYAGQFWGLAILALWPLTMLLARFIPQT